MLELELFGWVLLFLLLFLTWRRKSPRRRKTIDTNTAFIVNAKHGTTKTLEHIPEDVAREYKYQLKGYKSVSTKYNPTTQVLELYKI